MDKDHKTLLQEITKLNRRLNACQRKLENKQDLLNVLKQFIAHHHPEYADNDIFDIASKFLKSQPFKEESNDTN